MTVEEKINKNYLLWIECLKKYNCFSQTMIDELGDKIKEASFAITAETGAGKGTLLNCVLTGLCTIATHINECAFGKNKKENPQHPHLFVNQESLMKVLLLQHISKCQMFVQVKDDWKIGRGILYDFNPLNDSTLKLGEYSAYMCMKYGIDLSLEEYEAMKIIDKKDEKASNYLTPLCEIVKISNELCGIEILRRNSRQ